MQKWVLLFQLVSLLDVFALDLNASKGSKYEFDDEERHEQELRAIIEWVLLLLREISRALTLLIEKSRGFKGLCD